MWEPGNIIGFVTGLVGLAVSTYVALRKQKKDDTSSEAEIDEEKAQNVIKKWREYSKKQEEDHSRSLKQLEERHRLSVERLEARDTRQQTQIDRISQMHQECELRCARMEERLSACMDVMRDKGLPVPGGTDHHHPLRPDGTGPDRRTGADPDYRGPKRREGEKP